VSDTIAILEAAYVMAGDEGQWLDQLLDTARHDNLEHGNWLAGYTYDATRPGGIAVRTNRFSGLDDATAFAMMAKIALPKSEDPKLAPFFRNVFVGCLRGSVTALRRAGIDEERVREFESGLDRAFRQWGMADELLINAQDPTGIGCLIAAPRCRVGPVPAHEIHRWRQVAAHMATAFRVRRQLEGWSPDRRVDEMPTVEAILAPDGALQHAMRPAQTRPARAALVRAVKALERARGSLRRRNPEEALAIWRAMVSGRWSLLDHVDSDSRRYVLAHRNDPQAPDARGLTLRERQVVAYVALGHSNKVIAYELGLSTSTVGSHLARARAKLALPSAAALRRGKARTDG
jgi:DNA-binding CsgD family transcriptional regulator